METYARIVGSDRVALEVIDRLGLKRWLTVPARFDLKRWLPMSIGDRPSDPEAALLEQFRRNVEIIRDPLASVLTVSYTGPDSQMSASVANMIARVFLEELVHAQQVELTQSAEYLRERVSSVSRQLEDAQKRASDYQNQRKFYKLEDNNKSGNSNADELRYTELTRQLLATEGELERAQARKAQLGGGQADTDKVVDSLASPVITALRAQEAEVAGQVADLSKTLGDRHPLMINALSQLREVRRNIAREQARITAQVRSDVQVLEEHVRSLRAQVDAAEQKLRDNASAGAELSGLDSKVATTQHTYEDLLARFQLASEQEHLVRPPGRVITPARAPDSPDRKANVLIVGFIGFSSLTGGMGLALFLELIRRGYETADELERDLGVPVLATLPFVGPRPRKALPGTAQSEATSIEAVIYAEALQRLFVRVTGGGRGSSQTNVLLVTSPLPKEGKSTLTFSMARQVAASGVRVLLIGADLRKRRSSKHTGLIRVLSGEVPDFMAAVEHDSHRVNLDMLLADQTHPYPHRLLGSEEMMHLLKAARRVYDLIIIDTPPSLAFSDYAALSPLVDHVLLVVRWRQTSRRAVRAAFKDLTAHDAPLRGLVLNQVQLATYSRRTHSDPLSYYQTTSRYYTRDDHAETMPKGTAR